MRTVLRISLWGDEIESITEFDPLTGQKQGELNHVRIFANSHYVTPKPTLQQASKMIKEELKIRLHELEQAGRLLEAQRLEQRTNFDLEMIEAAGFATALKTIPAIFQAEPGEPPPTLFEYLPEDAAVSGRKPCTVPQLAPCIKAIGAQIHLIGTWVQIAILHG